MIRLLLAAILTLIFPLAASALPLKLEGEATQGGVLVGHTMPGASVTLDGKALRPTAEGDFVFGFGRDAAANAMLIITKGKEVLRHAIAVAPRSWEIQNVTGLPEKMVTPPPEVLDRIKRENAELNAARAVDSDDRDFLKPFAWPADGRISGVFGSQRVLNGVPKAPHAGLDIAAPQGTEVRAAAAGTVSLAEPDLYYTGGTVMIDHGHGLSTIYVHMSKLLVKKGDVVRQSDPIGAVGMTGRATGPHLHFGLAWFDVKLDPALLLPKR